ncbi:hypothetical protein [Streptomyces sp. NPDC058671]
MSAFRRSRSLVRWTPPVLVRRVLLGVAMWGARRAVRRMVRAKPHAP